MSKVGTANHAGQDGNSQTAGFGLTAAGAIVTQEMVEGSTANLGAAKVAVVSGGGTSSTSGISGHTTMTGLTAVPLAASTPIHSVTIQAHDGAWPVNGNRGVAVAVTEAGCNAGEGIILMPGESIKIVIDDLAKVWIRSPGAYADNTIWQALA